MTHRDKESVINIIRNGENCSVCGTELKWHLTQKGKRYIYHLITDEFVCSHECIRDSGCIDRSYQRYNKKELAEALK